MNETDTPTPTDDEWIVTDNESFIEIASTKTTQSIASVHGGRTVGEQYEIASRIAKVPQLERELAEALEKIEMMEIRHAATIMHTQTVVDEANEITEQRDRLAEALRKFEGQFDCYECTGTAEEALQSLNPKPVFMDDKKEPETKCIYCNGHGQYMSEGMPFLCEECQ